MSCVLLCNESYIDVQFLQGLNLHDVHLDFHLDISSFLPADYSFLSSKIPLEPNFALERTVNLFGGLFTWFRYDRICL